MPARASAANAFCATFTATKRTDISGAPPGATASCGTQASRFSSACSCRGMMSASLTTTTSPTTSSCPSSTAIVKNGGFECGISPWVPTATPGTTYKLSTPGDNSNTAFEVTQVSVANTSTGQEEASINQDITTTPGQTYTLTFRSFFTRGDAGFIGVKINSQPVYTIDASDRAGPNVWQDNTATFNANSATTNIRFEFLFGAQGSIDRIDNIVVF